MIFILRAIEDRDIEMIEKWLQEPHVAKWFPHTDAWITEIKLRYTKYSFIAHFLA